jgi:ABC-type polysaccharide/polyol phosphate export permease
MVNLPGRHFLHNLFAGRTLLFQLVRRDFKQRFVGSAGGWLWGLIHPLVLLVSYAYVFQVCLKVKVAPSEPTDNYTILLVCSFLPWLLFQETVMRSASSLIENANLITKTVFPSEIVAVAIFLSSLLSHMLAMSIMLAVVGIWGGGISGMAFLLPLYVLLLGLFAIGIGWIVSSLQVYLRDTAQILTVVMTFWFWMTPIFISEEQIPEQVRFLVTLNPLAHFVRAYRDRLLSYRPIALEEFALLATACLVVFIAGGLFFRHLKRGFADVL